MRVLVTGCAGFIAGRVCALLLEAGHEVVGVDNLNDAYDVRLKEWRLRRLTERAGFAFLKLDIGDRDALGDAFSAPLDGVVNLAARAGVRQSVEDPWVYVATNVTGTLNLLERCREHGVGKLVQASTSAVYGADSPRPFREDAEANAPLSPYAASKKGAEALCHTYHHLYGIDVSVLRYFTVYGPAGRPDMSVARFIGWIAAAEPLILYGDGTQERDFTYVDDVAEGTVAALRPLGYEVINLGGDAPVAINDVIALLEELLHRKAEVRREPAHATDVPATWADNAKAARLLDWEPKVSLAEGLRRTVEWSLEFQELAQASLPR